MKNPGYNVSSLAAFRLRIFSLTSGGASITSTFASAGVRNIEGHAGPEHHAVHS